MKILAGLAMTLLLHGIEPVSSDLYRPLYHEAAPYPVTRPLYATAQPWRLDSMEYARHFRIAEIGSFADIEGKNLEGFDKKIAYEWLAGFYRDQTAYDPFARWAYLNKEKATLNPHYTPNGNDFYYDLCSEEVRNKRVEYLIRRTKVLGLDGLFFDWANEEFLKEPPFAPLQKELSRRHPGTTYAKCIAKFLKALRDRGLLLVTNQAYRNPELLEFVDYDMSESYIMTNTTLPKKAIIDQKHQPIPVTQLVPLDEVLHYFDHLRKLKRFYRIFGFKNFIYMNYAAPKLLPMPTGYRTAQPREAIFYVYALTKMAGFVPFTEVPYDHALERTKLYFADLGEPIGKMQRKNGFLYRLFENGFILVAHNLSTTNYFRLHNLPKGCYYDLFDEVWLQNNGSMVIRLDPFYDPWTKRFYPAAKVFVHEDTLPHQR